MSTNNMYSTLAQQPKRLALFAALASLIALLAYLVLPYISITVTAGSTAYGSTPTQQSVEVGAGAVALFTGFISVEALLAVAILCIAGLFALRELPFGQGVWSGAVQRQRSAYMILGLGAVAIVYQFLLVSIGTSQINAAIQNAASSTGALSLTSLLFRSVSVSVSLGYAFGSWLYLLAMLAVVGIGWMIVRAEKPQGVFASASSAQSSSLPFQQSIPSSQPLQSSQPVWQNPSGVYTPPSLQPQRQSSPQYYPPAQPNVEQPSNNPYMPPYAQSWQQPSPPSNTGDWNLPGN